MWQDEGLWFSGIKHNLRITQDVIALFNHYSRTSARSIWGFKRAAERRRFKKGIWLAFSNVFRTFRGWHLWFGFFCLHI